MRTRAVYNFVWPGSYIDRSTVHNMNENNIYMTYARPLRRRSGGGDIGSSFTFTFTLSSFAFVPLFASLSSSSSSPSVVSWSHVASSSSVVESCLIACSLFLLFSSLPLLCTHQTALPFLHNAGFPQLSVPRNRAPNRRGIK